MADRKISDLTALTAPASGDYLPIVDISEAAAASKNKRITIEELFRGVPLGTAAAPSIAIEGDEDTGVYSPGADQVAISTNGTQRVTVDTAATTSTLPVVHPLGAVGTPSITFTGDLNTGFWSPAADTVAASTGGTERARMDSSGRLLVGTSSSLQANSLVQIHASSGNNYCRVSSTLSDSESIQFRLESGSRVAALGNYKHAGITNNCPFLLLTEEDNGAAYYWTDNSGNFRISSNITHVGTTSGTVVGTQTSDERLKNILGPVEYGLDAIKQIEPVRYALKSEPDAEKLGFIAQQVMPIVPQSVFDTDEEIEENEPTKLGMEYVALIPVLVNAIKELSAEVDVLKAQLQA